MATKKVENTILKKAIESGAIVITPEGREVNTAQFRVMVFDFEREEMSNLD